MDSNKNHNCVQISHTNLESQQDIDMHSEYAYELAKSAIILSLGEDNPYLLKLLVERLEGHTKEYCSTPITELLMKPNRSALKKNLNQAVSITQQKAIDVLQGPINENGETLLKLILKHNSNVASEQQPTTQQPTTQQPTTQQPTTQQPTTQQPASEQSNHPRVIVDIGGVIGSSSEELSRLIQNTNASSREQPVIDLSNSQSVSSWVINTLLEEKLKYREVQERSDKWKNINAILAITLPLITATISGIIGHYFPSITDGLSS
jgi:hypothetical protein